MKIKKYQMGGEMGAPMEPGMAPQEQAPQGGDPMAQLMEMAAAGAQGDCEAAQATCQMLLQVMQGGGAPAEGAPVFRKGGTIGTR